MPWGFIVELDRDVPAQRERSELAAGEYQPTLQPRDVRPPLAVSQIEGHLGLADDDLVLLVEVLRIARRDLPQRPSLLHLDPA